jgi:hypothetical protein
LTNRSPWLDLKTTRPHGIPYFAAKEES